MGFYYGPSTPPRPPSRFARLKRRIGRYIPRFVKNWWEDAAEIFAVTRMVLGIIMPVFLMLVAFIVFCFASFWVFSLFTGPSR